jgi:hypothetical protein
MTAQDSGDGHGSPFTVAQLLLESSVPTSLENPTNVLKAGQYGNNRLDILKLKET